MNKHIQAKALGLIIAIGLSILKELNAEHAVQLLQLAEPVVDELEKVDNEKD